MNLRFTAMFIGSMLVAKPFSEYAFPLNTALSEPVGVFYMVSSLLFYGFILRDEVV